jgi:hypothetical protein
VGNSVGCSVVGAFVGITLGDPEGVRVGVIDGYRVGIGMLTQSIGQV